jgi:hypothetical protein
VSTQTNLIEFLDELADVPDDAGPLALSIGGMAAVLRPALTDMLAQIDEKQLNRDMFEIVANLASRIDPPGERVIAVRIADGDSPQMMGMKIWRRLKVQEEWAKQRAANAQAD